MEIEQDTITEKKVLMWVLYIVKDDWY